MNKLEEILKEGHMVGELFGEPWRSLPKDNFDWLIKQAEKAERYEKALEKIEKTSGTSMFHNFTVEGHRDSVYIAEVALGREE
jgi:hypothetical protein